MDFPLERVLGMKCSRQNHQHRRQYFSRAVIPLMSRRHAASLQAQLMQVTLLYDSLLLYPVVVFSSTSFTRNSFKSLPVTVKRPLSPASDPFDSTGGTEKDFPSRMCLF
jgi:hypothetical protein